ncbi:hypothetical protein BCR43DRAFT_549012 [Syncephalastrum racemosum]|uniref:Uncharacterized protein n=1 Tax=Syncephalastrum racemosum TaxID=13706 RepID=A0A1X2H9K5_SYNRA|nr:hypothetical protein BCR43DRAFT_549012 [Syncephalastrum racemosum]
MRYTLEAQDSREGGLYILAQARGVNLEFEKRLGAVFGYFWAGGPDRLITKGGTVYRDAILNSLVWLRMPAKSCTRAYSTLLLANCGKQAIMETLKSRYSSVDGPNRKKVFVSYAELYDSLKKTMPELADFITRREMTIMVNKEKHFGESVRTRAESGQQKRACPAVTPSAAFMRHCNTAVGTWKNVGYIRKSPSSESDARRIKCLSQTATKLQQKTLCQYVYASLCCDSTSRMVKWDFVVHPLLYKLAGVHGGMQGMLQMVTKQWLTDDPAELRRFLWIYKQVKEIIVDYKGDIKIFNRHQLLQRGLTAKFKSCIRTREQHIRCR